MVELCGSINCEICAMLYEWWEIIAQVYILYGILMSDIPQKMGPKDGDHKTYI